MSTEVHLQEINYKGDPIKVGHPVRVLHTKKGGRDGFDALVKSFRGHVVEVDGIKKGKVTGFEVTDPKTGATRILGPERIVPYLRNVAAKVASLTPKNVVPITSTKSASAKKAAAAPKVN